MPIHHGELHRLTSVWSGLPPCSLVIFRHLQKTGGTSVVRLFEDLQRDLQWSVSGYWTPCWRGRSQHLAQGRLRWLRGLRMLAEDAIKANGHYANSSASFIGSSSSRFLDTPPWAARQLFHVHHPDAVECGGLPALQLELGRLQPIAHALQCRVVVAMVVRDPWRFFVSWWYYVGARRCGHCGFREFLSLNPNAQSHMAIGGAARRYSEALRKRHLSRDPTLIDALRGMLRGITLLAPTERLDEFVFALCEAAGIRVCPRPGVSNARNRGYAKTLLRDVAAAEAARRAAKPQAAAASGTSPGALVTSSSSTSSAAAAAAATAVGAAAVGIFASPASPDEPLAPNASYATHRRAVEAAGWLDTWLHSQAERALEATLNAGGAEAAAERRRRIEDWRRLPADASSGCLDYAPAAPAEVRAAVARAKPAAPAWGQGAGGVLESTGLRVLPKGATRPAAIAAAALGMPSPLGDDSDSVAKPMRSEKDAANDVARCARIRAAAASSAVAIGGGEAMRAAIPSSLRRALLDPPEGGSSAHFAAVCSTKIRLNGVKRGCHLD